MKKHALLIASISYLITMSASLWLLTINWQIAVAIVVIFISDAIGKKADKYL